MGRAGSAGITDTQIRQFFGYSNARFYNAQDTFQQFHRGLLDGVVFEKDIEYANPDGQHLKIDMARPKGVDGPFPAVLCIHGGGFRAGSRTGYDAL